MRRDHGERFSAPIARYPGSFIPPALSRSYVATEILGSSAPIHRWQTRKPGTRCRSGRCSVSYQSSNSSAGTPAMFIAAISVPLAMTMILLLADRSLLHERVQIRRCQHSIEIAERALVLHLSRRVEQADHRRAIERARQTDALHTRRRKVGRRERLPLDAHHEIERLRDRGTHGAHGSEIRQARGHQHVGAGLLEGL